MELTDFLGENSYVLMAALWVLGGFLRGMPRMPAWLVPLVLTGLGVGLGVWLYGLGVHGVTQGVLCAGGAMLCERAVRQLAAKQNPNPSGGSGGEEKKGEEKGEEEEEKK